MGFLYLAAGREADIEGGGASSGRGRSKEAVPERCIGVIWEPLR